MSEEAKNFIEMVNRGELPPLNLKDEIHCQRTKGGLKMPPKSKVIKMQIFCEGKLIGEVAGGIELPEISAEPNSTKGGALWKLIRRLKTKLIRRLTR